MKKECCSWPCSRCCFYFLNFLYKMTVGSRLLQKDKAKSLVAACHVNVRCLKVKRLCAEPQLDILCVDKMINVCLLEYMKEVQVLSPQPSTLRPHSQKVALLVISRHWQRVALLPKAMPREWPSGLRCLYRDTMGQWMWRKTGIHIKDATQRRTV